MDAESLFTSQYSTDWTTSPVSDAPAHNRSSISSSPNLPPSRYNSSSTSAMLNTPIPRTSPSMPHSISSSVDSHNPLQSFMSSELSNVYSTPLDPDTFSALAASGMLPSSLSQQLHPSADSIRNPYVVHSPPFLSTSPSHIVDGQYTSKLSYPHTISNTGPQIKPKETIVRRIACFLSFLYFSLRRSSNITRRSLACMFRITSTLVQLRCRMDPSTVGLQTTPPLRPPTTNSLPLTPPTIMRNVATLVSLLPCGSPPPLLLLPHHPQVFPIRCSTVL